VSSYQDSSAQLTPDQVAPAQVRDAQLVPVQPSPAIRRFIHTPPFHAVRAREDWAHTAALKGPKMSYSPMSCRLSAHRAR
jgi:hypothetical protein